MRLFLGIVILLWMPAVVLGQTAQTAWSTPDQLSQWIAFPSGATLPVLGIQSLSEPGRNFLRINWKQLTEIPCICNPNDPASYDASTPISAILMDSTAYSAIKVTLRHTMTGFDSVSGFYRQVGVDYTDVLTMPRFEAYPLPADGQWHTVTLQLADTPYLQPGIGVVFIGLMMGKMQWKQQEDLQSVANDLAATFTSLPSGAYLDIASIVFTQVPPPPAPTITDFNPKRAPLDGTITISGTGFAVPAEKNLVFFDDKRADVLDGTNSSLVVSVGTGGQSTISVVSPGGLRAVASSKFTGLLPPTVMTKVAGDLQTGPASSVLSPLSVKIMDSNQAGIPGANVAFRIQTGGGTLSVLQAKTDENGVASTVLTLPSTPAVVSVQVSSDRIVDRLTFTETATQ
jgi:IPT/TIG domain